MHLQENCTQLFQREKKEMKVGRMKGKVERKKERKTDRKKT